MAPYFESPGILGFGSDSGARLEDVFEFILLFFVFFSAWAMCCGLLFFKSVAFR